MADDEPVAAAEVVAAGADVSTAVVATATYVESQLNRETKMGYKETYSNRGCSRSS